MPNTSNETRSKPTRIYPNMRHLILCEGRDEWGFLVKYLNSEALSEYSELSTIVQVEDFGGNEELSTKLQLWSRTPGFEQIKTLVVIRDAERNAEGAVQSIMSAFRNANLPIPPSPGCLEKTDHLSTGFLLFPSCDNHPQNETLEDLCLSILEETDYSVLNEINGFLHSLQDQGLRSFPHEFKSKLHTYFSVTDDFVSLKIGEAAEAGAFDWSSQKLNSLRDFLLSMI